MAPRMNVSRLQMPLEFADDSAAQSYLKATESSIRSIHTKNRFLLRRS